MLSEVNSHPRDQYLKFYEEGHKYDLTLPLTGEIVHPISVTTLISTYYDKFNADKIIAQLFTKSPSIDERFYQMSEKEIMQEFIANKDAGGGLKLIDKIKNKPHWVGSKYYNMTKEEIIDKWEINRDECASLGTHMHLCIENTLNNLDVVNDTIEYKYFQKFWRDFQSKYSNFKIYRTEQTIFDEDFRKGAACCGSVDAILKDDKNNFIILDWKRSKEIKYKNPFQKMKYPFNDLDDTNYNHYRLQLSIYSHILTTKYNYNVVYLMLVIFHPNNENYLCIPVKNIDLTEIWDIL